MATPRNFVVFVLIVFVNFFGCISAFADYSNWQAPRPGDVRGPCPALNSLANHGILPRSGKGMTIPRLVKGILEGLNVGPDLTVPVGTFAMTTSKHPLKLSFDLDNLSKHNFPIEHDASLTRQDHYFGDNQSFNQTIWQSVLDYFEDAETANHTAASRARFNRVRTERGRNPDFTYTVRNLITGYSETAQYLSVFGNPITGNPPVEWLRIFFEEERLPYDEGWRPSLIPTTIASVAVMVAELAVAGGETLPDGLVLTETTVLKALAGKPLEGIV